LLNWTKEERIHRKVVRGEDIGCKKSDFEVDMMMNWTVKFIEEL
jgi:hypothetical protein